MQGAQAGSLLFQFHMVRLRRGRHALQPGRDFISIPHGTIKTMMKRED